MYNYGLNMVFVLQLVVKIEISPSWKLWTNLVSYL